MKDVFIRPFLKWPGRKYNILAILQQYISLYEKKCHTLVEPFIGSGAVFLNTNYKNYYLADCNEDLINLYLYLTKDGDKFIKNCLKFFVDGNNCENKYYELRERFNNSSASLSKAAIFLYLNRHGYNGLCRYNSKGEYNVPFGRYTKINLPLENMIAFNKKSKEVNLTIVCQDFTECFKQIEPRSLIYCDPPYVPLSASASFTKYAKNDFGMSEQKKLVALVTEANKNRIDCIISNHDIAITRKLYDQATRIISFEVKRAISCKAKQRNLVKELLAIYDCKKL